SPIMSVTLPESVDAWRMVSARRSFEGSMPVAALGRLRGALAGDVGDVSFRLDFGRDEQLGTDYVDVHAQAPLTMICQRTLEPFALLVTEDGRLHPADVIEDELLLALPLVPVNPDSSLPDAAIDHGATGQDDAAGQENNPFAVLRELKKQAGRGP